MQFIISFAKLTVFGLMFCVLWLVFVMDAVRNKSSRTAEARSPDFSIKGKWPGALGVFFFTVAAVYIVATGSTDTAFYALASAGMALGAMALWRVAESLGNYSFETNELWRRARAKTRWQALAATLFFYAMTQLERYFDAFLG